MGWGHFMGPCLLLPLWRVCIITEHYTGLLMDQKSSVNMYSILTGILKEGYYSEIPHCREMSHTWQQTACPQCRCVPWAPDCLYQVQRYPMCTRLPVHSGQVSYMHQTAFLQCRGDPCAPDCLSAVQRCPNVHQTACPQWRGALCAPDFLPAVQRCPLGTRLPISSAEMPQHVFHGTL